MGDGVLISDGYSSVKLTRAGEAHELGYPTVIDLKAGPFRGSLSDNLLDYGLFVAQLNAIHESLKGEAKLGSYEGFALDIIGSGKGGIEIRVRAVGQHVAPIELTWSFYLDQSYLPAIIRDLDAEFPPPYRQFP
jgi:hypothetical protein